MGGNKGKVKPVPVKLAPCYFCKREVPEDEHYCHGCGQVVCDSPSCDWNSPLGSHSVEGHRTPEGPDDR